MANELQSKGYQQLKAILASEAMKRNFENVLKNSAGPFMANILELYQSDSNLQQCDPNRVVLEALKAATLKLPINKGLGHAFIIPYKKNGVSTPQFQLGYKSYIQLAQRSGQYEVINSDVVCEGLTVETDPIFGTIKMSGTRTSDKVIGYIAAFRLINGFEKAIYWSREKVLAHAKRYSRAYQYDLSKGQALSPWSTDFDSMAQKTLLKQLLSKYGPLSVEMMNAIEQDTSDRVDVEVAENANKQAISIETGFADAEPATQQTQQEPQPVQTQVEDEEGPGF